MPREIYGRSQHDVQTEIGGGGVSDNEGGRRQTGVIVGRADTTAAEYSANTLQSLTLKSDIARYFGATSELGVQLEAALINGASRPDLYGVAPEEVSVTDEQMATGSGTLTNAPIIEQESEITVTNTADSTEYSVNFVYETLPTAPASEGEVVNINPNSGEFEAPTSDDYNISYRYLDWSAALDVAKEAITVGDVGGICITTEGDTVKDTLSGIVDEQSDSGPAIRRDYRLAWGLAPAMPNATGTSGNAIINASEYSDSLDNDALFVPTGARLDDTTTAQQDPSDAPLATATAGVPATTVGGIFGKMLGNQIWNPIYEDKLKGYGDASLAQAFSRDEAQTLRDAQTMPIMDPSRTASNLIEIGGNHSTSTATDYVRDFHRLTTKDNVTLNFRNLGEAARSEIVVSGEQGVINETQREGMAIMRRLGEMNVIAGQQDQQGQQGQSSALARTRPAESTGTNSEGDGGAGGQQAPYSVEVVQTDVDEIAIEYTYSPTSVVKHVKNRATIRDQVPLTGGSGSGSGSGTSA